MDDFPTHVRADQLVYSNVEAEHSPTNRRGFQVWLCSPRLRPQQREIARRLEDFDWPTPDAAANRLTERLVSFRTAAGDAVVARTVPLAERDALGRAGRFHAHAVVLSPDEFARVGHDPFAVLDHAPFQDSPVPVIAADGWRADDPFAAAPVPVGPPAPVDPAEAAAAVQLLPLLVRWLDGGDDPRPVAVPARPERVAALLRAVFRLLPPTLRAVATFDTLSTGQSLGTLPVRFAGAFDAPTLRDWPYRRAYRLDPDAVEFNPAPAPPDSAALDRLAAAWAADSTLTDRDRDGSYRLARALLGRPGAELPADPTDRAIDLARSLPGADAGVDRLVHDRLAADLPDPAARGLVEADVRRWVGPFGGEAIGRLRAATPVMLLGGWARERADRGPLTAAEATGLEAWAAERLARDPDPATQQLFGELFLIARRWGPAGATGVRALAADPQWAAFAGEWFPRWFAGTSPLAGAVADPARAGPAVDALFVPVVPDARSIDDAEILLAVAPDSVAPTWVNPLRFVVALHRGDRATLGELLDHPADRAAFVPWVYHQVVRYGWVPAFGLGRVDGGLHPGVTLRPAAGDPARGAALLAAVTADGWVRRQLFDWQVHAPPPGLAEVTAADPAAAAAYSWYEHGRWDKLEQALGLLTPARLGWVVNAMLADKVLVHKHATPAPGGVWLGLVPVSNGVAGDRFAGAYAAVVGALTAHADRAPALTHAALYALNRR